MAEPTLATLPTPKPRADGTLPWPEHLVADKAYDSDPFRLRMAELGIEVVTPHRRNRVRPSLQDGRALPRYRRRWKIERLIAWFGNFRRLVVRYERRVEQYLAFMHVACLLITLRYL